jgi:acylphosphatase
MPCNKIHISGSVYKTGFRYYLKEQAALNGITGRVYYENDASVSVTASGTEECLKRFLECCSPANRLFRIERVEVAKIPVQEFSSFEVEDHVEDKL